MKIQKIILTQSYTGFYFDDQKAIKKGATTDGFMYVGEPATPGFTAIRQ
ncbi:MAG: methylaspartate ammonia-lyase, partial [Bacillota bacterium]|nr:methylaspartate ammonia-lyase [Bacillota bacterium]